MCYIYHYYLDIKLNKELDICDVKIKKEKAKCNIISRKKKTNLEISDIKFEDRQELENILFCIMDALEHDKYNDLMRLESFIALFMIGTFEFDIIKKSGIKTICNIPIDIIESHMKMWEN